jgi:hypothetical protein
MRLHSLTPGVISVNKVYPKNLEITFQSNSPINIPEILRPSFRYQHRTTNIVIYYKEIGKNTTLSYYRLTPITYRLLFIVYCQLCQQLLEGMTS